MDFFAFVGRENVVKFLLEKRVNTDLVDKYKYTALVWAVSEGNCLNSCIFLFKSLETNHLLLIHFQCR